MALGIYRRQVNRVFNITSRHYCERKSLYQQDEEGPKPKVVYGHPYPDWRKPWIQRQGEFTPKLSLFIEKNPSPDLLKAVQSIPDLSFLKIKDWWAEMKEFKEYEDQRYITERVEVLGSNLGAAHFFLFRNAAVRFKGSDQWLSGMGTELSLPNKFKEGYFVEAIDCKDLMNGGVRYTGIQNVKDLTFLKWLSLKNNKFVDVWCLDRLAGLSGKYLEYLDITGCNLSVGCIFALARMEKLKTLKIDDPGENITMQAALSLLEQEKSDLIICTEEPTIV